MTKDPYICAFCGKLTNEEEYDYLVGYDHLACTLQNELDIRRSYEILAEEVESKVVVIPFNLIHDTPNDEELGEKIRQLYHDRKYNS